LNSNIREIIGGAPMGLSNTKEEQLRKMPIVESRVLKSKDGKFLIHKTIITDIKPLAYYEAVFSNQQQELEEETE
jgi:hypothetical protein